MKLDLEEVSLRWITSLHIKTANGNISIKYNKDLHILLVNFKHAYNSIDREQLWIALKNIEIPRIM